MLSEDSSKKVVDGFGVSSLLELSDLFSLSYAHARGADELAHDTLRSVFPLGKPGGGRREASRIGESPIQGYPLRIARCPAGRQTGSSSTEPVRSSAFEGSTPNADFGTNPFTTFACLHILLRLA